MTLVLPPDMDTPGLENENKSKPEATMLISESGGLYKPEVVAEQLMKDALVGISCIDDRNLLAIIRN